MTAFCRQIKIDGCEMRGHGMESEFASLNHSIPYGSSLYVRFFLGIRPWCMLYRDVCSVISSARIKTSHMPLLRMRNHPQRAFQRCCIIDAIISNESLGVNSSCRRPFDLVRDIVSHRDAIHRRNQDQWKAGCLRLDGIVRTYDVVHSCRARSGANVEDSAPLQIVDDSQ